MRNNIKKRLDELSAVSVRIITHGTQLSCALIFGAVALTFMGKNSMLPLYIAESAVSVFAIVIIGGLMFDTVSKRNQ